MATAVALDGLGTGIACGLANGALVSWGRLPPFIVTLGTMSIARGAALVATEGRPISGLDPAFRSFATGHVAGIPSPIVATIVMYADGFGSAATLLQRFLSEAAEDAALSIQMLMALAYVLMNTGRKRDSAERIDEAVQRAEALGQPTLLSRALGLQVVLRFMCGAGVD